jgi:hypothetical protein
MCFFSSLAAFVRLALALVIKRCACNKLIKISFIYCLGVGALHKEEPSTK